MSAALAQPASVAEHIADARMLVLAWLAEALNTKSVCLTEAELRPLANRLLAAAKAVKAA